MWLRPPPEGVSAIFGGCAYCVEKWVGVACAMRVLRISEVVKHSQGPTTKKSVEQERKNTAEPSTRLKKIRTETLWPKKCVTHLFGCETCVYSEASGLRAWQHRHFVPKKGLHGLDDESLSKRDTASVGRAICIFLLSVFAAMPETWHILRVTCRFRQYFWNLRCFFSISKII